MSLKSKTKVNGPFRVAFYVRVSTEEQASNPEGSIRNQEERLRSALDYKNSQGRFGILKGVFTDAGISAKDMKRPKLQELLRLIRNREIDLVMVTELSRLSRSTRDFIQMWDLMREHGCRFQSLREDFDTTNAAGEMVLFQMMNLAQFERRQVSERVEANFQARAARGLHNGGSIPLGYKRNPESPGHLLVEMEMAALVKEAFSTFIKKGTLRKAALSLNERGFRLKVEREGGGARKRSGIFTIDNLQAVLRNKAYIGVRVYRVKGEIKEVRAAWPAIIDAKAFTRAGEILSKNKARLKPLGSRRKMPYVLTGLLVCEKCKSAMSGKSATGNGGKIGYYEHVWATKRDCGLTKKTFKCEPHRIPSKVIEPIVWSEFSKFVNDPKFVKEIFTRALKLKSVNPKQKESNRLKAKLSGVTSQASALVERLSELPKGVPATPIYEQMEKLEMVRKELSAALESSREAWDSNAVAKWETFEDFTKLHRKFVNQTTDADQKRQLIQKFIRKVEIAPSSIKVHFIVDENHYRDEATEVPRRKSAAKTNDTGAELAPGDFSTFVGSNTLTVGTRDRT